MEEKYELKFYYELLSKYKNQSSNISYVELLNTHEWKNKRQEIINRDGNNCTSCEKEPTENIRGKFYRNLTQEEIKQYKEKAKLYEEKVEKQLGFSGGKVGIPIAIPTETPIILHVHHKYYVLSKLPWQYPQDALVTLCHKCHQDLHDEIQIPVYQDEDEKLQLDYQQCTRCNGSGFLAQYHYHENGICFLCDGNKYKELVNIKNG